MKLMEAQSVSSAFGAGELLADRAQQAALRRVYRRRAVMAGFALLGLLIGLILPFLTPTKYRASGRLQMFLRAAPNTRQGRLSKQGMTDQRELMLSRTFQEEVVARLSPEDRVRLLRGHKVRAGKHAESEQAELIAKALAGMGVGVDPRTQMMDVTFSSDDPRLAAAVVTAAMSAAEDMGLRLRTERTARVTAVLRDRLDDLERDIQRAQAKEDADQERLGRARLNDRALGPSTAISGVASEAKLSRAARKLARRMGKRFSHLATQLEDTRPEGDPVLEGLANSLNSARLVRQLAETRASALAALHSSGQDVALESQARDSDRMQVESLRLTLTTQQLQVATLARQLGPAQPQLQQAQAELDQTSRELARFDGQMVSNAQTEAKIAQAREAGVQQEFDQRRRQSSAEAIAQIEDQVPELNLAIDEDLDAAQNELLRNAQVDGALKASGFYIIDRPTIPHSRAPHRFWRSTGLGATYGLLAGLIAMSLLYLFDAERWYPAEAEAASGFSLVAVLPRSQGKPAAGAAFGRPEVLDTPQGLYGNALAELVSKILSLGLDGTVPVVLLTSSLSGEGRSTTAANLAVMLARAGARVLLVDADLHRPTLYRRFGLQPGGLGLSQVLDGRAELADAVQQVKESPGLHVLTAGTPLPYASQTLQGGAMERLLHSAQQPGPAGGFDFILLDAPAALGSSDGAYLARLSDVMLFVARYNHIDLRRMRRGARTLQYTAPPVSGLVVNALPVEP